MNIAASKQCDVCGNAQACVQNGLHCPHSYGIVVAEDRIWPWGQPEQLVRGIVAGTLAGLIHTTAGRHLFRAKREAMLGKSTLITLESPDHRAQLGCANVRDPPATNLDQVLRRDVTEMLVVDPHKVRREAFESAIQQNIRNTFLRHLLKCLWGELRGGN